MEQSRIYKSVAEGKRPDTVFTNPALQMACGQGYKAGAAGHALSSMRYKVPEFVAAFEAGWNAAKYDSVVIKRWDDSAGSWRSGRDTSLD